MSNTADNDVITNAYNSIIEIVGDDIGLRGINQILNEVFDAAYQYGIDKGYNEGLTYGYATGRADGIEWVHENL